LEHRGTPPTAGTPEPVQTPLAKGMLATVGAQIHDASNSRDCNNIGTQGTPTAESAATADATETSETPATPARDVSKSRDVSS